LNGNIILLGEYGSVAQGTATADSDHDFMGIYMESPEEVIGLEETDSKRESDAKDGEKSKPGSTDTTYHTLRKFVKLAAGGNPTIGSILFLPEYKVLTSTGQHLLDIRDAFVSKKAGAAYLGYMDAQIKAFNETGRKNRAELVEQYGYDIKFGYHAYRLGIQGITMMRYGRPELPLLDGKLEYAKTIRAGKIEKDDLLETLEEVRWNLQKSIDKSELPDYADKERINRFLVDEYQWYWDHGITY